MFKSDFISSLAVWILLLLATLWALNSLWNWVMPVLGLPALTFWQFAALFIVVRGMTTDLVKFKSKEKVETPTERQT